MCVVVCDLCFCNDFREKVTNRGDVRSSSGAVFVSFLPLCGDSIARRRRKYGGITLPNDVN